MTNRRVLQSIADMKAKVCCGQVRSFLEHTVSTPFPLWAWEYMVLPPDWSRLIRLCRLLFPVDILANRKNGGRRSPRQVNRPNDRRRGGIDDLSTRLGESCQSKLSE
jgi:hypothetical protein